MRRLSAATPLITRSAYCGLHGQAKFGLLCLFRRERRHGDTQEPNASGDGKERFEQSVAELFELDLLGRAACVAGWLEGFGFSELKFRRKRNPRRPQVRSGPRQLLSNLAQIGRAHV